eukprot:2133092-Alexandrium_andersonii.AAC.1
MAWLCGVGLRVPMPKVRVDCGVGRCIYYCELCPRAISRLRALRPPFSLAESALAEKGVPERTPGVL